MSKLDNIKFNIGMSKESAFPKTSEAIMGKKRGSSEFVREQFIDTIQNISDIRQIMTQNPKKFRQLLDKAKEKYDDLYQNIVSAIEDMEERIYNLAAEDYALELDDEDAEVDRSDIPEEMIASFVVEEWHHNMENKYDWAKDYFPSSKRMEVSDNDPIYDFMSKYVESIEYEIQQIYKDFINMDKKLQDNIRSNYKNIFDYIFDETSNLNWKYIGRN